MPLIALKCPQCGAELKIDDKRDSMFCEFCGAKVIREQNIVNNITIADGMAIHDAEWYYDSIMGLIKKGDMMLARELNAKFRNEYPLDDRWGEIRDFLAVDSMMRNMSVLDEPNCSRYDDWENGLWNIDRDREEMLEKASKIENMRKKLDKYSSFIPDMTVYDKLYDDYMSKSRNFIDTLNQIEQVKRAKERARNEAYEQKKQKEEQERKRAKTIKTVLIWIVIGFIVMCLWLLGSEM